MKKRKYIQGIYKPINPNKWILTESSLSKNKIKYRSSYELKFCRFLDLNPNVIRASSETVIVKYLSPKDNKMHRYYIDYYMEINEKGTTKKYLVEVKPFSQTQPPKISKNGKSKSYNTQVMTYMINSSKWKYAREFASKNDCEFIIITEKDLF